MTTTAKWGPKLMTRRFALGRLEAATTTIAGVVSTSAYLRYGHPYLARRVVADLVGFLVLTLLALATGRRLRHEAALCVVLIGAVVLVRPTWPLRVNDPAWWLLFFGGLLSYVGLRRHVCDSRSDKSLIDVIGSQRGRLLRIGAGGALMGVGPRRGDRRGAALAVAGLLPLAAGAADVCVLGPLVGGPLNGPAFRSFRAAR